MVDIQKKGCAYRICKLNVRQGREIVLIGIFYVDEICVSYIMATKVHQP